MKLRNKKTGEIVTIGKELCNDFDGVGLILWVDHIEGSELDDHKIYGSLAELNEVWEDYKPAEPLIKDEKIRKAVRAWAEANGEEDNIVFTRSCEYSDYMFYTNGGGDLCFERNIDLTTGSYTIAELCGEEGE